MTLRPLAATDETGLPARDREAAHALPGHGPDSRGAGDEAMLLDAFLTRLGDQIDDRAAVAFDEQFAELLAGPGPASRALVRNRRAALAVVCASVATGACVTIFAPGGAAASLIAWTAITVINLAYLLRR
ncbi:MAG TPA: hypothetical protein VGM53_20675 [Streptosporangiaceae bacterium]